MTPGFCGLFATVVGVDDDDDSGGFVLGVAAPVTRARTDDEAVELGLVVDGAAFEELELHPHAAMATTQTNAKVVRIGERH